MEFIKAELIDKNPSLSEIDELICSLEKSYQADKTKIQTIESKIHLLPQEISEDFLSRSESLSSIDLLSRKPNSQDGQNLFKTAKEELEALQKEEQMIVMLQSLLRQFEETFSRSQTLLSFRQEGGTARSASKEISSISEISEYIKTLQHDERIQQKSQDYKLFSKTIKILKQAASRKLLEKYDRLIYQESPVSGSNGSPHNLVVQKSYIESCRDAIFKQTETNTDQFSPSESRHEKSCNPILSHLISKITDGAIYYDVSLANVVILKTLEFLDDADRLVLVRQKSYFAQQDSQKYFGEVESTLKSHCKALSALRQMLFPKEDQIVHSSNSKIFDELLEQCMTVLKADLEYILPYLTLESRKKLFCIFRGEKQSNSKSTIPFEDLLLRLKYKSQDGDMFMESIQSIFDQLVIHGDNQWAGTFEGKKFQTLIDYFELGVFEAEESILQSSAKAFNKITANFSVSQLSRENSAEAKRVAKRKKNLNLILTAVSSLIQKFDDFEGEEKAKESSSGKISEKENQTLNIWMMQLLKVRESVRSKIYSD